MYHYNNPGYNQSDLGWPPRGSTPAPTPARRTKYNSDKDSNFNNNVDQGSTRNGPKRTTSSGYPQYTQTTVRVPQGNKPSIPTYHFSPGSPPSRDQALNHTAESWDYLQANLNLSTSNEGHISRSNLQGGHSTEPGRDRQQSPSPVRSHYTRSQYSPITKVGLDETDHSPLSKDSGKENSEPSTVSPRADEPQNVSKTSVGSIIASGGDLGEAMTYRARWERSRQERKDSISSNNVRSLSEPNRGMQSSQHSRQDSGNSVFTNETTLRSRSCDYAERNRSLLSSHRDVFLGQDLNRSALTDRSVLSATSFSNYMDTSHNGSLRRDPVTHRKLPNEVAKSVPGTPEILSHTLQRQRSINLSRISLSSRSKEPTVTIYGKDYGVHNSLVMMAFYSFLALALSLLSCQLLLRLSSREAHGLMSTDSVLSSNGSYHQVQVVAVTVASLVLMLDICCFLTCSMQMFFAAKLVKCQQGEERAFKYLKECTGTRVIALGGFFISIPLFLLGVMLYVIMEYRTTSAIIAVVVLTIGISFSISTMIHAYCFWRTEKTKADNNIPVFMDPSMKQESIKGDGKTSNHSELSTLV